MIFPNSFMFMLLDGVINTLLNSYTRSKRLELLSVSIWACPCSLHVKGHIEDYKQFVNSQISLLITYFNKFRSTIHSSTLIFTYF